MNKLRTLVYTVLDGVEGRALDFLNGIEGVLQSTLSSILDAGRSAVGQVVRIVFGLAETAVEETFLLVETVVELVIGKRDLGLPDVLVGSSLPDWDEYRTFELDGQNPSEVVKGTGDGVFEPGDPTVFGLNDDGEIIEEDN
ncbi:hypothetical protein LCGC14_2194420 [marine sediment metagenome]|uniref:Uncharacterized protein n=1 Tax=marine sediment metagenome TaxID=412755 RepID=A0A0F9FVZ4_9ZZZZ